MKIFVLLFFISLSSFSQVRPEAVGFYSSGSLKYGQQMTEEGEGFMRLYLEHNRGWGTEELIQSLTKSAADVAKLFPNKGRLQIEDLSAEKGGKIDRHGSHQNGLDVDTTYYRVDGLEHVPTAEQKFSPSMIIDNKISPNFDMERNWEFMKALHTHGSVNRIFVDQIIKNELCRHARAINEFSTSTEILRSLRHAGNHHDHLHVRLNCPKGMKKCRKQTPPHPGSGCPKI